MVNQFLQLFGSYDLFGKAVPGAALLLGVWSLLPTSVLHMSPSFTGFDPINFLALLITLLLLGLMIGQGIHTFADSTEKAFRWALLRLVEARQLLEISDVIVELDRLKPRKKEEEVIGISSFWYDWHIGSVEWLRNRFWGLFDSFSSHRYLFAKWFQWNYEEERNRSFDNRWQSGEKDVLMEPFCRSFKETFEGDIRLYKIEQSEMVYPLITTYLSGNNSEQYRQFQAIYSFCRSMWVVLLGLTIIYSFVIYQPLGELGVLSSQPRIQQLPDTVETLTPMITFGMAMVFLNAAGTYKRHFVEYVIASFATARNIGEDQTGQTSLNEF